MLRFILPVLLFKTFMLSAFAAESINPFVGTWKLVSITRQTLPSAYVENSFGSNPSGLLTYDADARMMVIIVENGRPMPQGKATTEEASALYYSMNSYAGTYATNANRVTHHIDVSWNQTWTGTHQEREYQFVGNYLILSLLPKKDISNGISTVDRLIWQKAAISSDANIESLQHNVEMQLQKTKEEIQSAGKDAVVNKIIKHYPDVFVLDYDGTFRASGVYPQWIGTNQLEYKDPSGMLVVRQEIEKAQAGGGWLGGRWRLNPDTQKKGCRKILILPMSNNYLPNNYLIGSWYFHPIDQTLSEAEQEKVCGFL